MKKRNNIEEIFDWLENLADDVARIEEVLNIQSSSED